MAKQKKKRKPAKQTKAKQQPVVSEVTDESVPSHFWTMLGMVPVTLTAFLYLLYRVLPEDPQRDPDPSWMQAAGGLLVISYCIMIAELGVVVRDLKLPVAVVRAKWPTLTVMAGVVICLVLIVLNYSLLPIYLLFIASSAAASAGVAAQRRRSVLLGGVLGLVFATAGVVAVAVMYPRVKKK